MKANAGVVPGGEKQADMSQRQTCETKQMTACSLVRTVQLDFDNVARNLRHSFGQSPVVTAYSDNKHSVRSLYTAAHTTVVSLPPKRRLCFNLSLSVCLLTGLPSNLCEIILNGWT